MNIKRAAISAVIAGIFVATQSGCAADPQPVISVVSPERDYYEGLFADKSIPPCEWEDGSDLYDTQRTKCFWDAGNSGNGIGKSYFVVKLPTLADLDNPTLIYVYEDGSIEA